MPGGRVNPGQVTIEIPPLGRGVVSRLVRWELHRWRPVASCGAAGPIRAAACPGTACPGTIRTALLGAGAMALAHAPEDATPVDDVAEGEMLVPAGELLAAGSASNKSKARTRTTARVQCTRLTASLRACVSGQR
jgi:hypothetical protein